MAEEVIKATVGFSTQELERAVAPLVAKEASNAFRELIKTHADNLEVLSNSVREKTRDVRNDIENLSITASTMKRTLNADLDGIKNGFDSAAKKTLIPLSIVIILAGVLAVWGIIGAVTVKLKDDAEKALKEVQTLQIEVDAKQKQVAALSASISEISSKIEEFKTGAVFPALTSRIEAQEALSGRLEAALLKLSKGKQ